MKDFILNTYRQLKQEYGSNVTVTTLTSGTFDSATGEVSGTEVTQTSRELVLPASIAYKRLGLGGDKSWIDEVSLIVVMKKGTLDFNQDMIYTVDSIDYKVEKIDRYLEGLVIVYLRGTDNAA